MNNNTESKAKGKNKLAAFLGQRKFRYGGYATILIAVVIAVVILLNVAIGAMYALIFFVLRLDQVLADYQDMSRAMAAVMLLIGNVTLALYDVVLWRFAALYIARLRPKLFK